MAKFQATFEVHPEVGTEEEELSEEGFAEKIEEEAGDKLMDLGYSNIDVKVL